VTPAMKKQDLHEATGNIPRRSRCTLFWTVVAVLAALSIVSSMLELRLWWLAGWWRESLLIPATAVSKFVVPVGVCAALGVRLARVVGKNRTAPLVALVIWVPSFLLVWRMTYTPSSPLRQAYTEGFASFAKEQIDLAPVRAWALAVLRSNAQDGIPHDWRLGERPDDTLRIRFGAGRFPPRARIRTDPRSGLRHLDIFWADHLHGRVGLVIGTDRGYVPDAALYSAIEIAEGVFAYAN
jgi:hypothetical protein